MGLIFKVIQILEILFTVLLISKYEGSNCSLVSISVKVAFHLWGQRSYSVEKTPNTCFSHEFVWAKQLLVPISQDNDPAHWHVEKNILLSTDYPFWCLYACQSVCLTVYLSVLGIILSLSVIMKSFIFHDLFLKYFLIDNWSLIRKVA